MSINISLLGGQQLTQWDVNRAIQVTGATGAWKAHFYTDCVDAALVVPPEGDTCPIPNFLLQHSCPITVAVYVKDPGEFSEGETVHIQTFRVQPRLQPQDYDYRENTGYIDWVEKSEEVQALMDDLKRRAESGEFDGKPGEPGKDGISPTVEVRPITGGHLVIITDKAGRHEFTVLDGQGGGSAELDPTLSDPNKAAQALAAGDGIRAAYQAAGAASRAAEVAQQAAAAARLAAAQAAADAASASSLASSASSAAAAAQQTAAGKQDALSHEQLQQISNAVDASFVNAQISAAIAAVDAVADDILTAQATILEVL